jgi:hypothetical protein
LPLTPTVSRLRETETQPHVNSIGSLSRERERVRVRDSEHLT